jgi:hypothetical protein
MLGCATSAAEQVSSDAYSRPQKTISAARALGAENLPEAKLYLSYAREGVEQADRAIQRGQNHAAKLALARAQADADLALTMTKQRRMAVEVHEINERINRLEQQLNE